MSERYVRLGGQWRRRPDGLVHGLPAPAGDVWGGRALHVGVHSHQVWTSPLNYGTSFNSNGFAMQVLTKDYALGITAMRLDTAWNAFETSNGVFLTAVPSSGEVNKLFGAIDQNIANAVKTVVCVNQCPTFHHPSDTSTVKRLPDDPAKAYPYGAAWGQFLKLNGRTAHVITEFWNEPNLTDFDTGGPRPAHYYDCLAQFYAGVKSTNPDAVVSNGAPETIAVVTSGATDKNDFIGRMYDRHLALGKGAGGFPWDLMAVHNYPVTEAASLTSNGTQTWRFRHLDYLIAEMELRGDTSEIILTESGYGYHENTDLDGDSVQPWEVGVTPESNVGTLTVGLIDEAVSRYANRATNPLRLLIFYTDVRKDSPYGTEMSPASNFWRHQSGFGMYRSGKGSDTPQLDDIPGITSAVRTRLTALKSTGA